LNNAVFVEKKDGAGLPDCERDIVGDHGQCQAASAALFTGHLHDRLLLNQAQQERHYSD
jgi:hypothetical protein